MPEALLGSLAEGARGGVVYCGGSVDQDLTSCKVPLRTVMGEIL